MPFFFLAAGGTFVLAARVALRFLRKHEEADAKDDLFFTDDDAGASVGRRYGDLRSRSISTPLRSGASSGALDSFLPQQHCLYEAAQAEPGPEHEKLCEENLLVVAGLPDGNRPADLVSVSSSEARRRAASVLKVHNWDDAGASEDWSQGSRPGSDRSAGGSSGDEAAQTSTSRGFEPSLSLEPQRSQQSSLNGPARSGASGQRQAVAHEVSSGGAGGRSQSGGELRMVDLAAAAASSPYQAPTAGGSLVHGNRSTGSRTDATTVPYRSCGTGTATITSSSSPDTSQFADLQEQRSESDSDARPRAKEAKERARDGEGAEDAAGKAALMEAVVAAGRAEQVVALAAAAAATPVVVGAAAAVAAAATVGAAGSEGLPLALRAPTSPPPEPMPLPPTILPTRAPDPQSLLAIQRQVETLRLQHLQRQAQALLTAPAASRAAPLPASSGGGGSTAGVDTIGSGYATSSPLGSMGGAGAATPANSMAASVSPSSSPPGRDAGAGAAVAPAAFVLTAGAIAPGGAGNMGMGVTTAAWATASAAQSGVCRTGAGTGVATPVGGDASSGGRSSVAGTSAWGPAGYVDPRVGSAQSPQRTTEVNEPALPQQGASMEAQQAWVPNVQARAVVAPSSLGATAVLSGGNGGTGGGGAWHDQLSPLSHVGGVGQVGQQPQGQPQGQRQAAPAASCQVQWPDAAVQAARMGTLQRQPRQQAPVANAALHQSPTRLQQQQSQPQQQGLQLPQPMATSVRQSSLGTSSAPINGTPAAHGGLPHSGTWPHPGLSGHPNTLGIDPAMFLKLQYQQQSLGSFPAASQSGAPLAFAGPDGQLASQLAYLTMQLSGHSTGQGQGYGQTYSQPRLTPGGGVSPQRLSQHSPLGDAPAYGSQPNPGQLDPVRHPSPPGPPQLPGKLPGQLQEPQHPGAFYSPPRRAGAMGVGVGVGPVPVGASAMGGFMVGAGTQQPLAEGLQAQQGHSHGADEVHSTPRVAGAAITPSEMLLSSPPSFRHHLKAAGSPEASESARRTQDWLNSSRLDEPPSPVLRPHPPPQAAMQPHPYMLQQQQQPQQQQRQQQPPQQHLYRVGTSDSTQLPQVPGSPRLQVSPSGRLAPRMAHQDTLGSRRSGGGASSRASSTRRESSGARRRREQAQQALIQQKLASQAPSQLALFSARLLRDAGEKLMPAPRMPGGGAFFVPLKHELRLEMSEKAGSSIVEGSQGEMRGSQQSSSTPTDPHSSFIAPATLAFQGFRGGGR